MTSQVSPPTVEDYLASLPSGIDSFPECQQKASVFREFVKDVEIEPLAASLPAPLVALVRSPPPVNTWLPEVHANAVFLGARATSFADDDTFVRNAYRLNVTLLQSPLYSILFRFISPERVLRAASSRWAQFHRGIELAVDEVDSGSATFRLVCPARLLPPLLGRCYGTAARAAIEAAGGAKTQVELVAFDERTFRFRARWS